MPEFEPEALPFYPITAAAREVGISVRTLYRWVDERRLKHYYLSGESKPRRKLVMLAHVRDYIRLRKTKAAQ